MTAELKEVLERIERRLVALRDYAVDQQVNCVYECLGAFEFLEDSIEAARKDVEKLIFAEEDAKEEQALMDAASEGGVQ